MFVVTLEHYRPAPRSDGRPWTQALIEEGPTADGPWTPLETVAIARDADPAHPAYRTITTELATLLHGWYRVTFLDEDGDQDVTAPVFNGLTIRPTNEDVATLLRARTKDENGNELGAFTADTLPTDDQVEDIITQAVNQIRSRVGWNLPDDRIDEARWLAKLYAAMIVEATFFSEQISTDRSPYQQFKDLYDEGMRDLTVTGRGGDGDARGWVGPIRLA